ncbi:hypothetical protein N657DRAFT_241001 [Parathielavia appendiculata]|uniref:Secreted protein n=1 Tax=Parathielavia appendiculata TaxID=2587402 RepID=A0AAN6TSS8_9PEZI|nr:hypothetical protein N657DRAFT_241001 [Parathielavia appendiculata]
MDHCLLLLSSFSVSIFLMLAFRGHAEGGGASPLLKARPRRVNRQSRSELQQALAWIELATASCRTRSPNTLCLANHVASSFVRIRRRPLRIGDGLPNTSWPRSALLVQPPGR